MNEEQFFHEVTQELAELDNLNSELQILSDELNEEALDIAYREYLDSILVNYYDNLYEIENFE